jgi:hypothetical protein
MNISKQYERLKDGDTIARDCVFYHGARLHSIGKDGRVLGVLALNQKVRVRPGRKSLWFRPRQLSAADRERIEAARIKQERKALRRQQQKG